ncbi:dedicator of cytokinesis spg isoform X2 [Brevipalpus obovatus]|uniref:dedicator of cytokinesis spg isoform X2 n=1 Tax=Brevipalpus obovatus TaxID=246614 RepID=UPI003D9E038D
MKDSLQSIGDRWQLTKSKKYAVTLFNYKSDSPQALDIEIGDTLHIVEEYGTWFRGFCTRNRSKIGIFPANFVALKPHKLVNEGLFETIVPLEDPVSQEVVKCLRDWHPIWTNQLYIQRNTELFEKIGSFINDLIEWRRQIIEATLTQDQLKELKLKITQHIDLGNRLLGLDLVPRVDGQIADPELITPIELYRVHQESSVGLSSSQRFSNISSNAISLPSVCSFLFLHIKDICFPTANFEDNFEFSFYLYDYTSSTQISEKYVVQISGTKQDVSKSNFTTVFTDLSKISDELYLLIQAQRIGKMLIADGKSSKSFSSSTLPSSIHSSFSTSRFKRPFGSAILQISELVKNDQMEKECVLKLFSSNSESDQHQVHDMIFRKQTNKLTQVQGSSISVSLKFLIGPEPSKVINDNPIIFQNISCLTSKMGFPGVIMPGDVKNDLYLVLESGEFEKGGKSIPKNIEATITLYEANGQPICGSISYGSGVELITTFVSQVLYHNNNPRWMESLKVLIPLEVFDLKAHLRIEFRHCSTKEYQSHKEKDKNFLGFSFIPLSDEHGTSIKDGGHELYLYKLNDSADFRNRLNNPLSYLCLPYGPKDNRSLPHTETNKLFRSNKESVHVRTLLCSTKLTQNSDLLTLLKWRSNPHTIQEALSKVKRLNGEEIVKFLQDILDALFSMFSTHDGNYPKHSFLVFNVLLEILSLLDSPKYEHFKPILDAYINGHFAAALVYKGLIISVKDCADKIYERDPYLIQKCFKSLEWIFKFIVQSRILYARATGDHSKDDSFEKELNILFTSFKIMLSKNQDKTIVESQVTFIDNFPSTYPQLLRVLGPKELTKVIKMIIDCLPYLESGPQVIRSKLRCIHETIKNDSLMRDPEARRELIALLAHHLKKYIIGQQELKLCSPIISDTLIFLNAEKTGISSGISSTISSGGMRNISLEIEILVQNLFEPIVRVIVELAAQTSETSTISLNYLHSYVSVLITLLRMMNETHYVQLLERKDRKDKKEFILQVFYVFKQIFQPEMYNKDWNVMKMTANHIILCSLQEFSSALIDDFLGFDGKTFDEQLWNAFFNLSVSFLTQSSLQLENFSVSKREAILHKYQDMRVLMGFLILSMWEKLGNHKSSFIPSMVAPFLEVTLVPEKELRKATLLIFYDMIDAEYKSNGSFKQVESQLIDKLDILVSDYRGDEEFKHLFNTILLEKVNKQNPVWKEQGIQMIHSITKLLELLLDYRSVVNGEENRDKRMSCTVNLLNFYRDEINRQSMYIRYIYKLCDLHISAENYAEAAFTLKLHADLLDWSYNKLDPGGSSTEYVWQRKEYLYLLIIDYFDKGKCWEEGIPLIKELANFYEKNLFDYRKLSELLKNEARFFDNILTKLRPEPEYFRVAFYGKGFPIFLRNKIFIYRGLEYEKIGAFTARLQTEFPQSQLLTKNSPPDGKILECTEQYIQICNVKPIAEPRDEFEGKSVPEKVLSYYLVNDVKTFTFDRPVHKGPQDKDNEFKSLWIERTILRTSGKLPGILRWFEVKGRARVFELSPVEYARETIENMNKELQKLISSYTSEPTKALSPLTMRLQGIIEAVVNGGIAKYHDAFFVPEFITTNQTQLYHIKALKAAIVQQVRILEGGLSLHGRLVPVDVMPLHKRLIERFTFMRQSIMDKGTFYIDIDESARKFSITNTPLPPLPNETKVNYFGHQSSMIKAFGEEDQIYSIPLDYGITPPIPGRKSQTPPPPIPPMRPQSAGFSNGMIEAITPPRHTSHNPSFSSSAAVQRSRSIPRTQNQIQSIQLPNLSSSHKTSHHSEVPPLPPRTFNTLERKKTTVISVNCAHNQDPRKPMLPERVIRKTDLTPTSENGSLLISIDPESRRSYPPPYQPPPPPPLPVKRMAPQPEKIINGNNSFLTESIPKKSDIDAFDPISIKSTNATDTSTKGLNKLSTIIKIDSSDKKSDELMKDDTSDPVLCQSNRNSSSSNFEMNITCLHPSTFDSEGYGSLCSLETDRREDGCEKHRHSNSNNLNDVTNINNVQRLSNSKELIDTDEQTLQL